LHVGMFNSCSKSLQQKEITLITYANRPSESGWKQFSSWDFSVVVDFYICFTSSHTDRHSRSWRSGGLAIVFYYALWEPSIYIVSSKGFSSTSSMKPRGF
jgi:hypothetical protein